MKRHVQVAVPKEPSLLTETSFNVYKNEKKLHSFSRREYAAIDDVACDNIKLQ
jgi:hypothetical protein